MCTSAPERQSNGPACRGRKPGLVPGSSRIPLPAPLLPGHPSAGTSAPQTRAFKPRCSSEPYRAVSPLLQLLVGCPPQFDCSPLTQHGGPRPRWARCWCRALSPRCQPAIPPCGVSRCRARTGPCSGRTVPEIAARDSGVRSAPPIKPSAARHGGRTNKAPYRQLTAPQLPRSSSGNRERSRTQGQGQQQAQHTRTCRRGTRSQGRGLAAEPRLASVPPRQADGGHPQPGPEQTPRPSPAASRSGLPQHLPVLNTFRSSSSYSRQKPGQWDTACRWQRRLSPWRGSSPESAVARNRAAAAHSGARPCRADTHYPGDAGDLPALQRHGAGKPSRLPPAARCCASQGLLAACRGAEARSTNRPQRCPPWHRCPPEGV